MKRLLALALIALAIAGCTRDAQVASHNLSYAADNFEIDRRVVFFNGITDQYLFTIEGKCSIEADTSDAQLEVTCKLGPEQYVKHFLGLSDNVTYFVEQLVAADVSEYHYKVVFKPQVIVPDIDLATGS